MYKVAICDDEQEMRRTEKSLTEQIMAKLGIDYELSVFGSEQELLAAYDKGRSYDLLILDIQLGEQNGILLAKALRTREVQAGIIFVTAFSGYALEGYSVQPVQYLLKPISAQKLEEAIRIHHDTQYKPRMLILNTTQGISSVPLRDIQYIEVYGHTIEVCTPSGRLCCRTNLSKLEEQLSDKAFIRCHKSYLVNLHHVHSIKRYDIRLKSGESIAVGKNRYMEVQSSFIQFHNNGGD